MNRSVKSICFYVNDRKNRAAEVRDMLAPVAEAAGLEVTADGGAADAVLALGGDGTMLRAVHGFPGVPLLGLNLGGLGYLASVGEEDFRRAVEMLARGEFKVAERSMLAVRKRGAGGGDGEFRTVALNDVVVMREMSGHAAILDLSVDEKRSTRYLADGIVVATPTGSTAYSLSAGGPVLMPDSESFVITPMNPHALGVRPLVVGDGAKLSVSSHPRSGGDVCKIGVYADGGYRDGRDSLHVYADSFHIGPMPAAVTEPTTGGFPFFAGEMSVSQHIWLDSANTALRIEGTWHTVSVKVNGMPAGKLVYSRSLDISKFARPGDNLIELDFVISNRNLLGPHHDLFNENGSVSPASFEIPGTWEDGKNPNYADRYNLLKLNCR